VARRPARERADRVALRARLQRRGEPSAKIKSTANVRAPRSRGAGVLSAVDRRAGVLILAAPATSRAHDTGAPVAIFSIAELAICSPAHARTVASTSNAVRSMNLIHRPPPCAPCETGRPVEQRHPALRMR
jgi:hypothetical protein